MPTHIINQFTQFSLSDSEQLAGQHLTQNQLMVLQNIRADQAIKKLNLHFDPTNVQNFLQQEAELTGWLNCLNYIIDCHELAAATTLQLAASDAGTESASDTFGIFQG